MDTHIAGYSATDAGEPLSARLPGEAHTDAAPAPEDAQAAQASQVSGTAPLAPEPGDRPATSAPREPRRRNGLLLGVSAITLALVSGGFLVSPFNHVVPLPGLTARVRHLAAEAGISLASRTPPPRPLAPAAALARVTLPPPPAAPVQPHVTPLSHDAQYAQLMSFRPGQPAVPAPSGAARPGVPAVRLGVSGIAGAGGPPPGFQAHEPGATPVPPAPAQAVSVATVPGAPGGPVGVAAGRADVTARVIASVAPRSVLPEPGYAPRTPLPAALPAAVLPPASAAVPLVVTPAAATTTPLDPAQAAQHLQAAPMSSRDQVQVLDLVTALGTLVTDLRKQDDALRRDLERHEADTAAQLEDFQRRLAFAEADKSIARATAASEPFPPPPVAGSSVAAAAAPAHVVPVRLTTAAAATAASGPPGAPQRFRVQAASPGLALLAQVDRGGGDGAQLQVEVGDTIPGYGRVKAIAQRGTAWVVSTEHGSID